MDLWLLWQSLLQVPMFLVQMDIQMKMRAKIRKYKLVICGDSFA